MQVVDFYKQPLECIPFSGLWEHSHAFAFLFSDFSLLEINVPTNTSLYLSFLISKMIVPASERCYK